MATQDDDLLIPARNIEVSPEALAEIRRLYHEAFRLYGAMALWSLREHAEPSAEAALAVTRALRTRGHLDGRRLAEKIEALCNAAD